MKQSNRYLQKNFIKLYSQGKSIRSIAIKYDVSKNSVSNLIQEKINLRPRNEISLYKNKIIDLYINGNTPYRISKILNLNYSGIKNLLAKEKLIKINRKYEHLSNDFIKDYELGLSSESIALKYNISAQTVINYLNYDGIKTRTYKMANRKLKINDCYFDNLNNEKAYNLGKVFALGTVQEVHKSKYLLFAIKTNNRYLIKDVISCFVENIYDVNFYDNKNSNISTLKISSEKIYFKLKEYGIQGNIKIPSNFIKDFYRGYFEINLSVNLKSIRIKTTVYKDCIINFLEEKIHISRDEIQENKSILIEKKECIKKIINYYPEILEKITKIKSKKWNDFIIEYSFLNYYRNNIF